MIIMDINFKSWIPNSNSKVPHSNVEVSDQIVKLCPRLVHKLRKSNHLRWWGLVMCSWKKRFHTSIKQKGTDLKQIKWSKHSNNSHIHKANLFGTAYDMIPKLTERELKVCSLYLQSKNSNNFHSQGQFVWYCIWYMIPKLTDRELKVSSHSLPFILYLVANFNYS